MERNVSADFLRIVATLAVIIIHVEAPIWYTNSFDFAWWTSNLFDAISRWCVPIFFMLSGMFLLKPNNTENIKTFIIKRFSKVLIPFLVFALVYKLWDFIIANQTLTFKSLIKDLITGNIEFHFWFIYVILTLYLLTPILRKITSDREITRYFLVIWFIFVLSERYLEFFHNIKIALNIQYFTGYVGYFLIGYYLKDITLTKKQKYIALITFVLSVFVTAFGHYILNIGQSQRNTYFTGYLTINVMLMSISIFLLFTNIKMSFAPKINKLIVKISALTFEIYLIHILVRDLLFGGHLGFQLQPQDFNAALSIPLITLIIFVLSLLLALIYKRIVNMITPG